MQANTFQITAVRDSLSADIVGRLLTGSTQKEESFCGTDELIALMENHMNENRLPVSATAERKLKKNGEAMKEKRENTTPVTAQEKNTFVVTVLYRQNATWQGTLKWVEGGEESKFRSALELIKLMDGAIGTPE